MAVYFDHNATTPLDPEVLEAMLPFLRESYGNPSSAHRAGRAARAAIEQAREQVAGLVNARPAEIVFTSGGTEANNLALQGAAATLAPGEIAVSAIEHESVLAPAEGLEMRRGWRVRRIGVDSDGRVTPETLSAALTPETRLVSVMSANNETGAISDIAALGRIMRERGLVFHTDAVQAAGKIAVDFAASGAHLMSLSAHKIYGPKGVGALVVDRALDIEALMCGGGHEAGRRAGTEHVAGIVGFGAAAARAARERDARASRLGALRARLESRLDEIPGVEIFASRAPRLPNTVFFAIAGIDGRTVLLVLDEAGFAVSSGSACGSDNAEPSHVLLAMGIDRERAYGALRVSFGTGNNPDEVDAFVDTLRRQVSILQGMGARVLATA